VDFGNTPRKPSHANICPLIFNSLIYLLVALGTSRDPCHKIQVFFYYLYVDIRTLCIRNLHTQWIGEVCAGILRNQYSKLLFIWLFYFRRWFFLFIVVQGFLRIVIGTFSCTPFRFFFIILSLSSFSSSENRSSSIYPFITADKVSKFSFGSSFLRINISVNLLKSNRFHRLFSKISLILLLTFLLIPMSFLSLFLHIVEYLCIFYDVHFM
jgi:hypothetical protein